MAKFLPLKQAVAENLHDGDTVAFEGFTHLIPTAAAHEAIRQGFKDLTLVRMTPDLIYDQMIGMGMARKIVFSYAGNPGVGLLRRLRDAVENEYPHRLEIEEHSHAAMANAYVDLGTYVGLTPYIGGGLGLAYTKYSKSIGKKDCKEVSPNSSGAGGFACDDPAGYDGQVESEAKFNFAYSLGAGLSYQMTKNVSLDLGYEYFAIPGATYVAYDRGQFNTHKGLDYHQVKLGFRYDLW